MNTTSASSAAPPPFAAYIDAPMPRALREEAHSMSFDEFLAEYASTTGPLRLGHWECADENRRGPQARRYQATLAVGDTISTSTVAASGPVAALTAMLYDRGVAVETTAFHQLRAGDQTATFIRASNGMRSEWAMGLSDDPTQSALRALIVAANRLMTA
jgi:hypothetical protein